MGLSVTLADGTHPCKFPKGLLGRHFGLLREQSDSASPKETSEPGEKNIDLPDVEREAFDLAVQFAACRSFQLNDAHSRTKSTKITTMLELVLLGEKLGLPGVGQGVAARLKQILISQRNALEGCHIETAYAHLEHGHPIRRVIVESLARAHLTFREDPSERKAPLYKRGEGDAARRNAFGGNRFIFQDQLDSLDEFNRELDKQAMAIMRNRTTTSTRSGKTTNTFYDPLSGEKFVF